MELNTLEDLLKFELQDIYSAEKQFVEVLPEILEKATSQDLKQALSDHSTETEIQIKRLEDIGDELHLTFREQICIGMQGLIDEGQEIMSLDADPIVKDAAIIVAVQKMKHYEIAAYGSMIAHADAARLPQIGDMLEKTLEEESETDDELSDLAETTINPEAED